MTPVPVRRLARSLLVALLAFLLLGGGVGFAMAAGGPGSDDALRVPAPHPGDTATYRTSNIVLDPATAINWKPALSQVRLQWLPEKRILDADYGARLVHPLRAEMVFLADTSNEVHYVQESDYDAADGSAIAGRYAFHDEQAGNGNSLLGVSLFGSTPTSEDYSFEHLGGQVGPCGASLPLQGQAYRNGTVAVPGHCDWAGGRAVTHFQAAGWEKVDGRRALRLTAVEDPRLQLWYASGIPFPVQAVVPMSEIIATSYDAGRAFRLELQDVQLGTGAYTPLAAPDAQGAAGPLPLAPRTPWLLDESGLSVPLPLQDAYKAMMAQQPTPGEAFPTAGEYVASHPGAYPGQAWFEPGDDPSGGHAVWYIILTDGHTHLDKRVARGPLEVAPGVYAPAQAGTYDQVTAYTSGLDRDVTGYYPTPDVLPAALPKPAPLADVYHRITGKDATSFGYRLFCGGVGCSTADAYMGAGVLGATGQGAASSAGLQGSSFREDLPLAGIDGRLAAWETQTATQDGLLGAAAAPPAQPAPANLGAAPNAVWAIPSAPAAAGVGLLALATGALYYFWPALRGLPLLGLFSRIERGRVAEHPQRARILNLVAAEPGIHHKELGRRLGLGQGTLDHHVRKLEAAGELVRRSSHGYTCYFLRLGTDRHLMDGSPVVKSPGGRAVLHAVASLPDATYRSLAAEAGLSTSTVEHHLRRLREAGLVEPAAIGLRISPAGQKVRATLGA